MEEKRDLEWKVEITNSFLKTVSAFSNFGTGEIKFGINDDGTVIGIENPKKACLDLENKINDAISPKPDYRFSVDENNVITLLVQEGPYKPYLYKGKAYRRNDTATVEVDQMELKRLTLEGMNLSYEALPAIDEDISFHYFEQILIEKLGITKMSDDVLRTLGFYTKDRRFNNAATLFADVNSFSGVDIARFGESTNIILDRETIAGISVLEQYDRAVALFRKYYQYDLISGMERKKVDLVPETAFREALANALVHRNWDIPSHIRIAMYADKIEITSPGGLPNGITEDEYLNGNISNLRNPVIGNIFYRLNYIEMFGTGIHRIKTEYQNNPLQPEFSVSQNTIRIVLPVLGDKYELSEEERKLIEMLSDGKYVTSREIADMLACSKEKAIRITKRLVEAKYIKVMGNGRGTKYTKA